MTQELPTTSFDYSGCDDRTIELCKATARIASAYGTFTRRTVEKGYELGRNLNEIKERLKHGQFMPYVASIGVPHHVANYWMDKVRVQPEIIDIYNLPTGIEGPKGDIPEPTQDKQHASTRMRLNIHEQEPIRQPFRVVESTATVLAANEQEAEDAIRDIVQQRDAEQQRKLVTTSWRSTPATKPHDTFYSGYRYGEHFLLESVNGLRDNFKIRFKESGYKMGEIDIAEMQDLTTRFIEVFMQRDDTQAFLQELLSLITEGVGL